MYKIIIALLLITFSAKAKPLILTSNNAVKLIISELTGAKAETDVIYILPDSAPKLKSSDIFKLNAASCFIYLSDKYEKSIKNIQVNNKIALFDMLPDSNKIINSYGRTFDLFIDSLTYTVTDTVKKDSLTSYYYSDSTFNTFFYLDPLTLNKLIPVLTSKLKAVLPQLSATIENNSFRFSKRLELLHKQISKELENVKGMPVYSDFPFLNYYIKRYNLSFAASLQTNQELGKKYTEFILKDMDILGINAIFVIPELNKNSYENMQIKEIDAFAKSKNYTGYSDFMIDITRQIKSALMFY